ncbi:Protein phosphatase 1, regulatory subunit [Pseudoloma neurophilia]|uniref:Protein phosphatase 1, regulatory subunit n=1 Tax=Pseudoloma neurophilia TaxID=146866 RepID=A0A0R0LX61_9MICR|nr:Protein phosphatase 1, regulatory subunit [Pseudoloma neurophilia]
MSKNKETNHEKKQQKVDEKRLHKQSENFDEKSSEKNLENETKKSTNVNSCHLPNGLKCEPPQDESSSPENHSIENSDDTGFHEYTAQQMKLDEIPDKILKIPDLRHLNLQRNHIRSMELLSVMKTLEKVDLADNLINEIFQIPNVKSLDLGYNLIKKIENLPESLQHLYLMANDITKIENLPSSLITVDLACNEIDKIENLNHLHNLEELYLGNNLIEHICQIGSEDELGSQIELSLKINQNKNDIITLNGLEKCHTLSLQGNKLKVVDCAYLPPNLQYLSLSENRELSVLKNLDCLENLIYLDIWRTELKIKKEGVEIIEDPVTCQMA